MHRIVMSTVVLCLACVVTAPCAHATVYPASQCNISYAFFNCTEVSRWCEATTGAIVTTNPGVTLAVSTTCTMSHCPPGHNEPPTPSPATKSCSNTITFSQSGTFTTTGGIDGSVGWLVADLKASLQVASGTSESWTGSTTQGVSVTLAACEWQKHLLTMQVVKGKKLCRSATIQGWGTQNCGAGVTLASGAAQNGQVCGTFDIALVGTIHSPTIEAGFCPPGPPPGP